MMTSRQRVLTALRHEQPDRIPLDIGGTESSGMTGIFYNALREHLGLPRGQTQVFEPYQQVVKIEPDMREALAIDTIPLLIEPRGWKPFALPDGSPCEIPRHWNPVEASDGGGGDESLASKCIDPISRWAGPARRLNRMKPQSLCPESEPRRAWSRV